MSIDTVAAAIGRVMRTEAPAVSEATRLVEDLGMDSSAVFGLLFELEDTLAIQVDTDTLQPRDLATVGAVADLVEKCRQP